MTTKESAPVAVTAGEYLLVKRGLYYRPNSMGYTGLKADAGRYPATDASPDSGVTAIHENDAPMFAPACCEDVKVKHLLSIISERDRTLAALAQPRAAMGDAKAFGLDVVVDPTMPPNSMRLVPAALALQSPPAAKVEDEPREMTAEEHRLEDHKQMAAYVGPIVSFDVAAGYYLASCDRCGWVGSSDKCGTDSYGDDSDVYCPRCYASGADCGQVASALQPAAQGDAAGPAK